MKWYEKLRCAQQKAGHNNIEAAKEIGVAVPTFESWIHGRRKMPDWVSGNAQAVANYVERYTDMSVSWSR